MGAENLGTASLYINNLLLSRGLLRNGQAIDFARPDLAEGGLEASMGRIMSVVNDLVLRRDRDSEQREALSQTIRTLRADALQQNAVQARQLEKYQETSRKLGLAEGVERALKSQLRAAEAAAKSLKEEMARLKVLVNQTRFTCANEVRKRERVIEGLKKHVGEGGRARGSGKAVGVAVINVVAGVGGEERSDAMSVNEKSYDLRSETNEFLTRLAGGLSEENEVLSGLVRGTFASLKELSGWQGEKEQEENTGIVEGNAGEPERLTADLDAVIEHLRRLLTNPSFVPLEEVEVREEEIARLRDGWEKMEGRWRDAVLMMNGWRERMERGGHTVNIDEITQGLKLSPIKEIAESAQSRRSAVHSEQFEEEYEYEEGDTQADIDAMDDSQVPITADEEEDLLSDEGSSSFEEEVEESSMLIDDGTQESSGSADVQIEAPNVTFTTLSSAGTPPQLSPLRSLNTQDNLNFRNHDAFTTILEENTWEIAQLDQSRSSNAENRAPPGVLHTPEFDLYKPQSPTKSSQQSPNKQSASSLQSSTSSRLPRPRAAHPVQSPITTSTIASKLLATEREADAARVRAKLKAAKLSSASAAAVSLSLEPKETEKKRRTERTQSPVKIPTLTEDGPSKKRKTAKVHSGRASRRRSTLSPWELESLLHGEAEVEGSGQ